MSKPSNMLINLMKIVDLFFVIDIFANFLKCYYSYEGVLIRKVMRIFKRYMFSWFLIDLFSILPVTSILHIWNGKDYSEFTGYNRLIRIIRFCYKMSKS